MCLVYKDQWGSSTLLEDERRVIAMLPRRRASHPVYQKWCGCSSDEAGIFISSKRRLAGSVCVSLTAAEVKCCPQDLLPTAEVYLSFPLQEGTCLSEVTRLCKQPPSPNPWQGCGIPHPIPCLSAVAVQQGKHKGGVWKGTRVLSHEGD